MLDPTNFDSSHTLLEPQGFCTVPSLGEPKGTHGVGRRTPNRFDLYQQSNLTLNQVRVWIAQALVPEVPIYHLPAILNICGDIDPKHFQKAFQVLINSSDALRTVVEEIDGIPTRRVLPELKYVLDFVDLSHLPKERQRAKSLMEERCQIPLNWQERLFDSALIKLASTEFLWYLNVHHLICDGWSFELIYRHMADLYQRSLRGYLPKAITLLPFADYIAHEHAHRKSSRYQKAEAYWKRELTEDPSQISFYGKVPLTVTTGVRRISYDLGPDLTKRLRSVATSTPSWTEQTSMLGIFVAVLVAYLHCMDGKQNYTIGIPFHNRRSKAFKETLGLFSEILPVRIGTADDDTFASLTRKVREEVFKAARHGQHSIANPHFKKIYEVVVNYHTHSFREFAGMPASPGWIHSGHGDDSFALHVHDFRASGNIVLDFELHQATFNEQQSEQVVRHFVRVLEAFAADPHQPLRGLTLLSPEEARQIVLEWNRGVVEPTDQRCVHEIFEEQVAIRPNDVAVVFEDKQVTYQELNRRANKLAHFLRGRGVGLETLVGLYVERSPEMLVGLLGILKAGATYVPLDPKYPGSWLKSVLDDTRAPVLLTQQKLLASLSHGPEIICLDSVPEAYTHESEENLRSEVTGDHLACVIYTSGSTGMPKGVEITHAALANYVGQAAGIFGLSPADRVLQFASVSSDISVEEIFPCLMRGATLILRTNSMPDSAAGFLEKCRDWGISVLDLPTAYWHELTAALFSEHLAVPARIRLVIIGGERAIPERLALWQACVSRGVKLLNTYGPTETTVVATVYDLTDLPTENGCFGELPIGCPILNVNTYVLDQNLTPVPVGVPGELCIGGVGLARGYLNQPELTAERFVQNPFLEGARLYRTGDLVRYRPDGNLEFVRRIDRQVKVRGFRVELDGIEAALRKHPLVADAVVVHDNASSQKGLIAYLIPKDAAVLNSEDVSHFIKTRLPDHMVPTTWAVLESLPRSLSGKLDRRVLPLPQKIPLAASTLVPPRTPTEVKIADLWRHVLGLKEVGRYDHFFELGGHSLLAVQIISRLRKELQVEIPLRIIFDAPTVAQLAEHVDAASRAGENHHGPVPAPGSLRRGEMPLSHSQSRIWYMHQLSPESAAYNISAPIRFTGLLHKEALKRSVEAMAQRHESLRTTFRSVDGNPVQVIAPAVTLELPERDLRAVPEELRLSEAKRILSEEARYPFDLEKGPLIRLLLLQLGDDDHVLLINMHHVISDQWSMGIIAREVTTLYNACCKASKAPMDGAAAQYADFATWQDQSLTPDQLQGELSYWRSKLADAEPLTVPTDYPRPAAQTFHGAHQSLRLSTGLVERLKKLAAQHNATSYIVFLAAFKALLARYSGQHDVTIGSPVANRGRLEWENIIGTFINIVVLRTDLSDHPTFRQVVERVREVALDAFAHAEVPFERLVQELQPDRDPSRSPLIQVLFNFQSAPVGKIELLGLSWMPFEIDQSASQFDISVTIDPEITRKILVAYNTDLYNADTIARFLRHYERLLELAVADPDQPIAKFPILSDHERRQLLHDWNETTLAFPHRCVHELFEAQARQNPDSVAVVFEEQQITYRDLDCRADQVARRLRTMGVKPEGVVGICVERSPELVIGLLGVLKAGGAYLPIDPAYPLERIGFMIEDSGMAVLLTQEKLLHALPPSSPSVLCLDRLPEITTSDNLDATPQPSNLAYVIYTSGSTGRPKGVEIEHRALVNFLHSMRQKPGLTEQDIFLSVTTISFDIAALEIFLPLTVGARVVLASRATTVDGRRLKDHIEASGATIMQATPATWRMLIEAGWTGCEKFKILCGGEAIPLDLATSLLKRGNTVWNLYGPTETTVWSSVWQVDPSVGRVSIGKPINNTQLYILDANLEPVPVGVPGELYIGGKGVARGYLKRPELTTEKFMHNPHGEDSDARMFRTGDLARHLPDGNIEWLGRIDHQVKIRGHRIELQEIETLLNRHPGVKQAVIVARENASGEKQQLLAYLVAKKMGATLSSQELRNYLKRMLPDYMIPSFFSFLVALPLTPNGKVDRRMLPLPDQAATCDRSIIAPRDRLEFQLTKIWENLLNVSPISVQDNFFEIGGHSLLAVRLTAEIEKRLGKVLPVATLFNAPTVEQLAVAIRQEGWSPPKTSLVEIRPGGSKSPLFFVGVGYRAIVRYLSPDIPAYGLSILGVFETEVASVRLEDIAASYVQSIRTLQPKGPYYLAGASANGTIAFEMARQLHGRGEEVALLALFDRYGPGSKAVPTLQRVRAHLSAMRRMETREKLLYAMARVKSLKEKAMRRLRQMVHERLWSRGRPLSLTDRNIDMVRHQALGDYVPQLYPGRAILFRARDRGIGVEEDPQCGWGGMMTGGLEIYEVPGDHTSMLQEPHVRALAKQLGACISKVQASEGFARALPPLKHD